MLYREISRILSVFFFGLTLPLLFPLGIAFYHQWIAPTPQPPCFWAFAGTILASCLLGLLFHLFGRRAKGTLYRREALLLVLLVYFLTPVIGGLPFFLSRTLTHPIDCYFEAVSGLTTTGATLMVAKQYDPLTDEERPITQTVEAGAKTVYSYMGTLKPVGKLTGIEAVSPAVILWRSMMQWLGGGGIVVLFVAILPALGIGGKILVQTELTGPSKESLTPRIKETASQLWKIYLGLTITEIFLLMITNKNLSFVNATALTFSTLSTGGFTPFNASVGALDNTASEWIILVFMILGSIGFSLYFYAMRGKFRRLNDPELKAFLAVILFSCLFATWQLLRSMSFADAFRNGAFQVISAQTSTGFTTENYDVWPFPLQTLMLILMFVGGMAGSTAGGLKVVRHQISLRILLNKIESIFRPDTVRTFRLGETTIDSTSAMTVLCYILIGAALTIVGTLFLTLDGVDPETSLTTISCMINNVGIAFRGASTSFAFLSDFGKILSSVWMIAGRLEFFALLIAFVPAYWRKT